MTIVERLVLAFLLCKLFRHPVIGLRRGEVLLPPMIEVRRCRKILQVFSDAHRPV
jgi:hypothetical protein